MGEAVLASEAVPRPGLIWAEAGGTTALLVSGSRGGSLYAGLSLFTPMSQGQEADWLKRQAEAVKSELSRVEARIRDLEARD